MRAKLFATAVIVATQAVDEASAATLEDQTVSYVGYAQVVAADPIVSRHVERVPVKRCTLEYAPVRRHYRDRYDRTSNERRIKRCRTTYESRVDEEITGYNVTLRYNGETLQRRSATHPGNRVPLQVEVMALDE